ncbi:MAG: Rieske 2Fe-2S domain-containing protein [Candidatus Hydrothermarchaeales archaeon]
MSDEEMEITRREIVKYVGVIGAAVTASAPVPIIAKYLTPNPDWPAEKGETPLGEVNLGKMEDIPVGGFKVFSYNFGKAPMPGIILRMEKPVSHQTIGATTGKDISGAEADPGIPPEFVAYSLKCPHLGCIIEPAFVSPDTMECPCHFSTFDMSKGAAVTGGPSPNPLPELALEVRGDEIVAVGWRDLGFVGSLDAFKAVI